MIPTAQIPLCRAAAVTLAVALAVSSTSALAQSAERDWPAYGRTQLGDRHSPATQITTTNVGDLEIAWRFSTGEAQLETPDNQILEATPIVVEGLLYAITPLGKVFALNPTSGVLVWLQDFAVAPDSRFGDFASRGVSYWRDHVLPPETLCASRILAGVIDGRLAALDARTGAICTEFGSNGFVDLKAGLRTGPSAGRNRWEYALTSPPAIIGDLVVVGSAVADNGRIDAASGEIRAFNARSGEQVWTWDPIPQDARDPAYDTWGGAQDLNVGGANAWSVMAADADRDLVFVPTSSPSVDYWGGHRPGDNRYANSIVALRGTTGEVVWHFQTVHHDLWDYDNASPPALVTIQHQGRARDVVLQATKTGQLFVLDRNTGEPVFPIEERPVPASDVPGERASPTQPFNTVIPPLSPQFLERAWGGTTEIEASCQARLNGLRNEGPFTPPSLQGSLVMPSNIGGAHWGGVAFDPARMIAVIPVNTIASVITLIPRDTYRRDLPMTGSRIAAEDASMAGTPYVLRRQFFLSEEGGLCTPPPHGSLVAVDLATGRIAWTTPLGSAEGTRLGAHFSGGTQGFLNLGGAITTAGGVTFIGAAPDAYFRAFATATGEELWRAQLPAGARSTPMTYVGDDGRQYVVVAAGGDGEDLFGYGDEFIAFALRDGQAGRDPS